MEFFNCPAIMKGKKLWHLYQAASLGITKLFIYNVYFYLQYYTTTYSIILLHPCPFSSNYLLLNFGNLIWTVCHDLILINNEWTLLIFSHAQTISIRNAQPPSFSPIFKEGSGLYLRKGKKKDETPEHLVFFWCFRPHVVIL